MNIGFVHYHAFPEGGAEKVTSNLAPYLTKKGHQIFLFVPKINEELLTDWDKQHIHFIETKSADFLATTSDKDKLIKTIQNFQINILIFVGHLGFDIEYFSKNTHCKIIFAHHGSPFWEITDLQQYLLRELSAKNKNFLSTLKHKYIKIPKILREHKENLVSAFRNAHQYTDAFVVLCEEYKNIFKKELHLPNIQKIMAISNGILPAPMDYSLTKKKQLLYVGRMSYADKRVDRLIEIWKNIYRDFPDWEFLLVGDGEDRKNLEKQAENLDRIHFLGSTKNPSPYYNEASILCMSSQFEGIPLVLLEAQQAGVIPMAFNCSAGVESILSPSWENGVLVENFSLKNYENSLRKLMSDENLRQKIQKNILQKSKEYDMEIIAEKWHQLFLSLKN